MRAVEGRQGLAVASRKAQSITTGEEVIVAAIDSGIDISHPEMAVGHDAPAAGDPGGRLRRSIERGPHPYPPMARIAFYGISRKSAVLWEWGGPTWQRSTRAGQTPARYLKRAG
jgi:hypothetical protein